MKLKTALLIGAFCITHSSHSVENEVITKKIMTPEEEGRHIQAIFSTFLGQLVGGLVTLGIGTENGNPEQQAQGLQMFAQGIPVLAGLLMKNPTLKKQILQYIKSPEGTKILRSIKI